MNQGPTNPNLPLTADDLRHGEDFEDHDIRNLVLEGERLFEKSFYGCSFRACNFQSVELEHCSFEDVDFTDCNLSLADLRMTQLHGCTFRSSKLTGIDWTLASWSVLTQPLFFDRCALDLCHFVGLVLHGWTFLECSIHEADFSEAVLGGARFLLSDLAQSRFHHTSFENAHMEGAYNYALDSATNRLRGGFFSLPDAATMLLSLGIQLVDAPDGDAVRKEQANAE